MATRTTMSLFAFGNTNNNEFICYVVLYWKTDSIQTCQEQFVERFGDNRHPPSKSTIWALAKKIETHGTLLDRHAGGREQITQETITNVKNRQLASPSKSLRRLSQETGMSKSSCQRAAKKAKLHAYRYTVVHELKETSKQRLELSMGYFQQDAATCHTSNASMAEIQSFFAKTSDNIMSQVSGCNITNAENGASFADNTASIRRRRSPSSRR
ncbi:hypothetical protein L9F63_002989, partial [Diploptera punctata]